MPPAALVLLGWYGMPLYRPLFLETTPPNSSMTGLFLNVLRTPFKKRPVIEELGGAVSKNKGRYKGIPYQPKRTSAAGGISQVKNILAALIFEVNYIIPKG